MSKVFANGLENLGSIPGRVIPMTLKMTPPCLTLSNIRYVSRVKWSNPGKGVAPSPTPRCSSYWSPTLLLIYKQISFERLNWRRFSSFLLSMNKTFSKSYFMPPAELTLDYILWNYCLLDTTCFTYAEVNFIRVSILGYRRLTWLLQTSLHNSQEKNMSTSLWEKILWRWLI